MIRIYERLNEERSIQAACFLSHSSNKRVSQSNFSSDLMSNFDSVYEWHFWKWGAWLFLEDAALCQSVMQNISSCQVLLRVFELSITKLASQCEVNAVYMLFILADIAGMERQDDVILLCVAGASSDAKGLFIKILLGLSLQFLSQQRQHQSIFFTVKRSSGSQYKSLKKNFVLHIFHILQVHEQVGS